MNKRKTIATISLLGCLVLYGLFHTRELGLCEIYCGPAINKYQDVFLFFPLILFFSLLTYKMKDSAFKAWWQFAKWAIPIIFLASFIIAQGYNNHPGDWLHLDYAIDLAMYIAMYSIFILGSTIQIFRGYNAGEEK